MNSPKRLVSGMLLVLATALPGADKPAIGLIVQNAQQNNYWWHGGAEAVQDVFVTEINRSGKNLKPVDATAIARAKGVPAGSLLDVLDEATAQQLGKLLGVQYLAAVSVREFSRTRGNPRGTFSVGLFDVSTGEIVWADEFTGPAPRSGAASKQFTGSDEELGALIAWLQACLPPVLKKFGASDAL